MLVIQGVVTRLLSTCALLLAQLGRIFSADFVFLLLLGVGLVVGLWPCEETKVCKLRASASRFPVGVARHAKTLYSSNCF